ncbi:patatin-like phospholipase family protein [Sphingopyxis sp. DHUNG17]|jgi:NTE family protein|uniref:patatin-like phospholipase family protein n=1 Tax=Sphingopyxis jiangsuensis TaxID=2871171 RepID=UPI00191DBE36|nr:patatin-like phospholipase family protein [Sphingopyxis lutea]MBL0767354.1 patatin-like phospholipase family protein [Sphingopyxis lutea]
MPRRAVHAALPLPDLVVLVLQGGGALGAYQAGVYEALIDLGIELDWVAGISIGAINAAIIAGNPRDEAVGKMRNFWDGVSSALPALPVVDNDLAREWMHLAAAGQVAAFGVPGFFAPRWPPPGFAEPQTPAAVSLYDTAPLAATLDRLVDWDRVNGGSVRLSVGAVAVETGNFRYFDTRTDRIDARHILASGALPPGLPPVEIDGVWYWDGGLVSNTPLEHVVQSAKQDMLVFQVDLFPARGERPHDLEEAWSREKDIRYSSRTRRISDGLVRRRKEHQLVDRMLSKLPDELLDLPEVKAVRRMVDCHALNVVQLIHQPPTWQTGARDFEFSRSTMETNWALGRAAVEAAMKDGHLLAQSIVEGRSEAFAVQSNALRPKVVPDAPDETPPQKGS